MGIYTNGGLVMGPGGSLLEKHALGNLVLSSQDGQPDFISALLDFCHDESVKTSLLKDVGFAVLMPTCLGGCETAYTNVDEFAELQMVTATKMTKEELIAARSDVMQVMFLFPPIKAQDKQSEKAAYESTTKVQQEQVIAAMRERGLMDCSYAGGAIDGVGAGLKVIPMKDPWPEIDINVAGVDKGKALSRFLQHRSVLDLLRVDAINVPKHVAVFGDAANDVPMFQAIGSSQAGLRVVMPHSDDKVLDGLATVRAEVSEVLNLICEAKLKHRGSEAHRLTEIMHGISSAAKATESDHPGIATGLMKAANALAAAIQTRTLCDEQPGSAAVAADVLDSTIGSKASGV